MRQDLLQHGQAVGEDDPAVVHQDDVGGFVAPDRGGEQRGDVHIKHFGEAGDHRRIGQAGSVLPAGNRGVVDGHLLSKPDL